MNMLNENMIKTDITLNKLLENENITIYKADMMEMYDHLKVYHVTYGYKKVTDPNQLEIQYDTFKR